MTTAQSITFETQDQGEEAARAELYGLLAALFYAPPSQTLLEAIAEAPAEGNTALEHVWNELTIACRYAKQDVVRDEYERLFIGVGKPDVLLYGSFYLSGFLMEKPLAELRTDLAQLGLERSNAMVESEDHLAALCEVMRHLITSEDVVQASLTAQQKFFSTHMGPWVRECCEVVENHPDARFYKLVARFAREFFDVEMQAFDMN
jgi:TorA maturation chaperone TorD